MNGIKFVSAVIVAAALCVSTAKVNAMTVVWVGGGGTAYALEDQTTGVPQGDAVYLGIFKNNMSNAAITALYTGNANAATDILAQFNIWNQDQIGSGVDPGVVGAFGAVNTINPGNNFFTSNAFLVVIDKASGPAGVTEIGVYTYADGSFLFPASDGAAAGNWNGNKVTAGGVIVGTFIAGGYGDGEANGGTGWFGDGTDELVLATIVPEPSTFLLVAMGLLGAWGMRRRRS